MIEVLGSERKPPGVAAETRWGRRREPVERGLEVFEGERDENGDEGGGHQEPGFWMGQV